MISPPHWFSDVWFARLAISIVDNWQWTPFCFFVCLAGLQSLPEEVYEAAALAYILLLIMLLISSFFFRRLRRIYD